MVVPWGSWSYSLILLDGYEDQVENYMQSIYTVPGAYNIMLDPPLYTCPIAS